MEPLTLTFGVRSYETGVDNRLSLPSVCNYFQEAAGEHAHRLGFGIFKLQQEGLSWVLSRLHLRVEGRLSWGDRVTLETWPCGLRGRLSALRDFRGTVDGGEGRFEGVSEWLVVDLAGRRIVRPPAAFCDLVSAPAPRVALAGEQGGGKFAVLGRTDAVSRVLVRRSDHDFNDHVNNVHYVEWALEPVAGVEAWSGRVPAEIDIVFRQAAHAGDEVESRLEIVDGVTLRHALVRPSDGALLVTAETKWSGGAD